MVNSLGKAIVHYPTSFGVWSCLHLEIISGTNEIAIIANDAGVILTQILKEYIPHKIVMRSGNASNSFPLLSGKKNLGETTLYLCRNYSCERPVSTIEALMDIIRRK